MLKCPGLMWLELLEGQMLNSTQPLRSRAPGVLAQMVVAGSGPLQGPLPGPQAGGEQPLGLADEEVGHDEVQGGVGTGGASQGGV